MALSKPILLLDFDGVVHQYSRGWQGGDIYDPVTEGFFYWAELAKERFDLQIYSSRSKTIEGRQAIQGWLWDQASTWCLISGRYTSNDDTTGVMTDADEVLTWFTLAHEKPPTFLTIDDRCIQFRGRWDAAWLDPDSLVNFKPWNVT